MSTRIDEPRTYGMWSRPRNEGLWGFTWATTLSGFAAVLVTLAVLIFFGPIPGLVVALLGLTVLIPLAWTSDGRSGYERGTIAMQFLRQWWNKEHVFRGGPFSRMGNHRLPGLMASTDLYAGPMSGGGDFGMIHTPKFDLYTVALWCAPRGGEGADQPQIDSWVGAWGRLLATLGGQVDVDAITTVIDCRPETGDRLAAEVRYLTKPDAPRQVRQVMDELARELPTGTVRMDAWMSITFKPLDAANRRDPQVQLAEIGGRLPSVIDALRQAGVEPRPMTAEDMVAVMRRSWDPADAADLDRCADTHESHGLSWTDAGPVSYHERRRTLEHGGFTSAVWEMAEAPQGNVNESVLERLLEPTAELPRKRVAIVFRPHSAGDAAGIVDDDFKNAMAAGQQERTGSAHASLRVQGAQQAREEQARGHGVTRFSALITVTAPEGVSDLSIEPAVKHLSSQSRLKIRRCEMYQSAAFAAGLGLGVVLPEMASISRALAG
ncbi:SCO6880 family protein [Nocardia asteroides]|uniref:SCO6880 family protein n=1 Tax=Nocardia asteroides TaxID=1824 RepID=UPI001E5B20C3|nr:SCO6880 family protein [Nocardia asteroides]UGT58896.1 hypothetical protein LTT85_32940 [Nocardia asteroides]